MTRALPDLLESDPMEPRGIVYFIEGDGVIKIGFSTDVGKRLADLRTGTAAKIELIEYARASREVERAIHQILASERVRGEWFKASDKTIDLMYLISDFLDTFDDEDDRGLDGRDSHVLTVTELRDIVARPYHWQAAG